VNLPRSSKSNDWSNLTVAKLKVESKILGLVTSGKNAELVSRLEAHDSEFTVVKR
jgi:hypothetical protein